MQLEAVMQVCTDSCIFIIEKCHSVRCLRLTSNKLAEVYALIHIPDKEEGLSVTSSQYFCPPKRT